MQYDIGIIGAGWAGFNAAQKARAAGLKTALIEKEEIGGTCLNKGCIPTKALIQSAKICVLTGKSAAFGIETSKPKVNFTQIQARKDKIISQLRQGMDSLLQGIDVVQGEAEFLSADTLKAGARELSVRSVIIATGSRPMELEAMKFDGRKIISSDDALNLKEIPQSLLIVGGGVIGCEFAQLFLSLGAEVSIVERMPQLIPGLDKEAARKLENIYKKKGIKVNTNTDAATVDLAKYQLVLLCIGRVPEVKVKGLDRLGLECGKGGIAVDEYLKTHAPNIYAAGDCTGKIQLAHFAAYQGILAARNIAYPDNREKCDNTAVPTCIFSEPEIASVGLNEDEARGRGIDAGVYRIDFLGSGMARILDETDGFIKVVSDKLTGRVLGAVIIGPRATELIAVLTLAVSSRLNISQLKDTIFAHPTLSECIHDALK